MGKLIHLSQIKEGLQLKSNVEDLLESYDAVRVLTEIAKDEGDGYYNVEELLDSLKSTVDEQLGGDGEGSVDDRINQAKEELQGLIDNINEKEIRDYVKVKGSMTTVEGNSNIEFNLPEGMQLEDLVPQLDTSVEYPVYFTNNKPVRDAEGNQVTYNFDTETFSDIPHEREVTGEGSDLEINFKPISGSIDVKLFPIGEFTYSTLPKDFLLDNKEIKVVSYSVVIDDLVVGVASNTELIDEVKSKLTEEVIANAISDLQETLEARIKEAEDRLDLLEADEETEGSIRQLIKELRDMQNDRMDDIEEDLSDLEDKTAADLADAKEDLEGQLQTRYEELYNLNEDRAYEIRKLGALTEVRESMTATEGQDEFVLGFQPAKDKKIDMFVNGVKYTEDIEYEVAGQEITWLFKTSQSGFDLEPGFKVEFAYTRKKPVEAPEYIGQ